MNPAARRLILCADDFALTSDVSRGIARLAEAGRLSATSALVTTSGWPADASMAGALRSRLAVGLHLNLTEGAPLGPLPRLAPDGRLPGYRQLVTTALAGRLAAQEVRIEIERQLDRFERDVGYPPDFVDGHHHVHVLPTVRAALLEVLARRHRDRPLMIRDPSERFGGVLRRPATLTRAMAVRTLALGFRHRVRAAGFVVNDGFAGFSSFGASAFARELDTFLSTPGRSPLVMCHPGEPGQVPAIGDALAGQRAREYQALMDRDDLTDLLWRPARSDPASPAFTAAAPR